MILAFSGDDSWLGWPLCYVDVGFPSKNEFIVEELPPFDSPCHYIHNDRRVGTCTNITTRSAGPVYRRKRSLSLFCFVCSPRPFFNNSLSSAEDGHILVPNACIIRSGT